MRARNVSRIEPLAEALRPWPGVCPLSPCLCRSSTLLIGEGVRGGSLRSGQGPEDGGLRQVHFQAW